MQPVNRGNEPRTSGRMCLLRRIAREWVWVVLERPEAGMVVFNILYNMSMNTRTLGGQGRLSQLSVRTYLFAGGATHSDDFLSEELLAQFGWRDSWALLATGLLYQ